MLISRQNYRRTSIDDFESCFLFFFVSDFFLKISLSQCHCNKYIQCINHLVFLLEVIRILIVQWAKCCVLFVISFMYFFIFRQWAKCWMMSSCWQNGSKSSFSFQCEANRFLLGFVRNISIIPHLIIVWTLRYSRRFDFSFFNCSITISLFISLLQNIFHNNHRSL